jgi:hypothetical protein
MRKKLGFAMSAGPCAALRMTEITYAEVVDPLKSTAFSLRPSLVLII